MATRLDGGGAKYRRKSKSKPRRAAAFTQDIVAPTRQMRHDQRQQTRRAQKRAPKRPVPALPILKDPTPKQATALRKAHADVAKTPAIARELAMDPRQRNFVRAVNVAVRLGRDDLALKAAKRAGVKGSKEDRIKAGREIVDSLPRTRAKAGRHQTRIAGINVSRELDGRGTLASINANLATKLAPVIAHANPLGVGAEILAATGVTDKPMKFMRRAAEDILNFPATAIPSVYVPAAGAVEAAKGDSTRIKQFWKDVKETDPVVLAAQGKFKEAGKAANEHPGFAALELYGLKGTIGRGTGATMRSGALGKKAKAAAATEREARRLPGTTLRKEQTHSRDVITKATVVVRERQQAKKAADLRRRAKEALDSDDPKKATELRARANAVDPTRMRQHDVQHRVNQRVMVNESLRRTHRDQAVAEAHKALGKKGENPVTVLVAQNILRAKPEQIQHYIRNLADEAEHLESAKLLANKELRAQLRKALKGDMTGIEEAAARYAEVVNPRTERLVELGLLDKKQAERSRVIPYAIQNMEAKHVEAHWETHDGEPVSWSEVRHVKETQGEQMAKSLFTLVPEAVRGPDGKPLTTAQIKAHMRANPDLAALQDPAFITQAPNMRGARNFFKSQDEAPSISGARRTGEATRQGTFDAHPDVLLEGAARMQGLIDAAEGFRNTVGEFAFRSKTGRVKTVPSKRRAQQIADDHYTDTGVRLVPVRINPWAGRSEQLARVLDDTSTESRAEIESIQKALTSALEGEDGEGPWALIPEDAQRQLVQHTNLLAPNNAVRVFQKVSQTFRSTVLATSPTWLAGNFTEGYMRMAISRAGVRSYAQAYALLKELKRVDPKAYEELHARALGGGHYGMTAHMRINRDSTQFRDGRVLAPMAKVLGTFWRTPGPKQAAAIWHRWTDIVFRQLSGRLETQFQTAMLGKALRTSPLMDGRMVKLSRKANDEAVQGLRDTNNQAALADEVMRMYGRYEGFSPGMRHAIATYTPFVAWTLNAVKFVYQVLPADHPTITALMVATERATEEWRKDNGLDLFIDGALPGFMQGSLPTKDGGHQRFPFRYTPFGAFGDPLGTAAGAVLPQFSGVLMAFRGKDWTGDKDLRKANGQKADPIDLLGAAAVAFTESTVPIVGLAERLIAKGPSALNPVAPIGPKESKDPLGDEVKKALGDADTNDLEKEVKEALGK